MPEDRGRLVTAFLVKLLRALRRYRLHRRARGAARRHLRRQGRLARGDAGLLGRVPRAVEPPRTSRSATSSTRSTRNSARTSSPPRGRRRPARVPGLPRRPARPAARADGGLHRLLQLPGMPIHAPLAIASAEDDGDDPQRGQRELGARPGERRGDHRAPRPLRRSMSSSARRTARGQDDQAAPGQPARRAWTARRSTSTGRSALLSLPRAGRPHPETRRGDRGRDRPLRALYQAWAPSSSRSSRATTCSRSASTGRSSCWPRPATASGCARPAPEGQGAGRDPQGPLRPLCPARQDGRQPAAQPGDGGCRRSTRR